MVISAEIRWPDVGDIVYAKTSVHVVDFQVATVRAVSVDSVTVQWNSNSLCDTIHRGIGMIHNDKGDVEQKIWPVRVHPIQEPLILDRLADPTKEMLDETKTAIDGLPTESVCDYSGFQLHCNATEGPAESILQAELSYDTSLMTDVALPLNPVISSGPVNRNLHSVLPIPGEELAMMNSNSSQSKTKGDPVEVVETTSSSSTKERLITGLTGGNISNLETLGPHHHLRHLRFDNFGDVPNINTRLALASPSAKVRTTYHH